MISISKEEAKKIKDSISFLIVTATDIETELFKNHLSPIEGRSDLLVLYFDNQAYTIGKFGLYSIIHVQCSMGSVSRDSSLNTTKDSIDFWEPTAIIMLGIAFGSSSKKYNIGDVLISETVIPYEPSRIGKDRTIYRGNSMLSGKILFNRFKNFNDWKYELPNKQIAQKVPGGILSGEKLIDNEEFKKILLNNFSTAVGGEMEAVGVCSAAEHSGLHEWIIVKGICDWADGKKGYKKKLRQTIAMTSAIDLCLNLFSVEHILDDLKKNLIMTNTI